MFIKLGFIVYWYSINYKIRGFEKKVDFISENLYCRKKNEYKSAKSIAIKAIIESFPIHPV